MAERARARSRQQRRESKKGVKSEYLHCKSVVTIIFLILGAEKDTLISTDTTTYTKINLSLF